MVASPHLSSVPAPAATLSLAIWPSLAAICFDFGYCGHSCGRLDVLKTRLLLRASYALSENDLDSLATNLVERDLTAADFQEADGGSGRPDFSQPFQFGYSFSGDYSSTALDVDLLLDNMTVEITTVPEPTSIGLGLSLGAAFVWHRWFRTDD